MEKDNQEEGQCQPILIAMRADEMRAGQSERRVLQRPQIRQHSIEVL
jgi:hypothetical protein